MLLCIAIMEDPLCKKTCGTYAKILLSKLNLSLSLLLYYMGEEKFSTWMKITVQKSQAYMGFMVMMGLVKLPSLKDWKRDEMFHYSPIASRISRDCFHDLHFVDNATLSPSGSPGYKKLGKIQPILDVLCQSFQSIYI